MANPSRHLLCLSSYRSRSKSAVAGELIFEKQPYPKQSSQPKLGSSNGQLRVCDPRLDNLRKGPTFVVLAQANG